MDKVRPTTCTIYAIQCIPNKKVYIGRTTNLQNRIRTHFYALKNGKYRIKALQKDFDEYGKDAFQVFIIEEGVDIQKDGQRKEMEYTMEFHSYDPKFGYNPLTKAIIASLQGNSEYQLTEWISNAKHGKPENPSLGCGINDLFAKDGKEVEG